MTTTLVEVVYPSTSSFSGTSQLDIGPFFVPSVNTLLRVEISGRFNSQGAVFGSSSVEANLLLWGVQYVPTGSAPADVVTSADGPQWLFRQQLGNTDNRVSWAPDTDTAAVLGAAGTTGEWAGQQLGLGNIDLWFSARTPTGVAQGNVNYFGSIRFWWT